MTLYVKIMPNDPPETARIIPQGPLVVALVYDGLCTFEFGIAAEIFGLYRPEMGQGWYRFALCPVDAGPMRAHGGFLLTPEGPIASLEEADLIVIPGWKGAEVPVPEALLVRLRNAHARGARLASICSGAFVLAATGLLDGARVTTHWRYADAMRQRYPAVTVDENALYHGHNRIFTSAGSAAGIDLMIDIVRQDFGPEAANSVARRIVLPAHRSGGQAQFVDRPVRLREGAEISPLLDAIRLALHESWAIPRMAREARMSTRTFLRRFAEATGSAPGAWLTGVRLEAAREMLLATRRPVEEIAEAVGMGSAHALRHHFRQRFRLSPVQYRSTFAPTQGA